MLTRRDRERETERETDRQNRKGSEKEKETREKQSERRRNRELQFAPLVSETENKKKIVLTRLSCSSFIFLKSDSIS